MKRVLVLGAGLVSRPMVRYLLDSPDIEVTVASRTVSKAEVLVGNHPRGKALPLLVDDAKKLDQLVSQCDLAVSLLPYTYHVEVAGHCLKHRRHMVTTSYVSDAMRALDQEARKAGVIILNEVGVDPGTDHMSAMRVIHRVKEMGGRVTSFMSYCGGLPAPEANDNPFGYKFSWSPKGVVMAGRNEGRYLKDGQEVVIPGEDLFGHHWPVDVPAAGAFEAYPNRNSLPYIGVYGLEGIGTMYRGTLRNQGWCETLKAIADLGILDDTPRDGLAGMTVSDWVRLHVPGEADLRADVAVRVGLADADPVLERLEWLGFFGSEPVGIDTGSDLDVLAKLMLDKMPYRTGERDMIVLYHEFKAEYPDKPQEAISSTMIAFGEPDGDSAMARTVSLPAAVSVRKILEGRISMTGVHIPVAPDIYEPVLAELETLGIEFKEKYTPVE